VKGRRNYLGGFFGWVWLAIIFIPVYYIVITSFKDQGAYFTQNPLALPNPPTLTAYQQVVEAGIIRYFFNSVIVTVGAVIPLVLFSFLASYAIVRGESRLLRFSRTLFLLGLAIPLQATIIPIYLIITRIHMYDTLGALILPSIAFGIPLTVLILSNFIRDVPRELFESMRLDGCTDWQMAWRLAFPLTRPAIVTVSIYNGLNVWNGFLFALILTQSPEKRVMPLALWAFQGEYTVNIPAVLAAVVLSTLPILVLYVVGRRQLLRGLMAGFGK
jgi:raffinose/stachyose/melibiose transport system permease protein